MRSLSTGKTPRDFGDGLSGKRDRLALKANEPVNQEIRKEFGSSMESPVCEFKKYGTMATAGIKGKSARMQVTDRLKSGKTSAEVAGNLSQMRNLLGGHHHELAGRDIGSESVVAEDQRVHAHRVTDNGPRALQTNSPVHDAKIRSAEGVQLTDHCREIGMEGGDVSISEKTEGIFQGCGHALVRVDFEISDGDKKELL
jgi:hypothetical protein